MRTGHDFDKLHLNCGTIVNGSPVTDKLLQRAHRRVAAPRYAVAEVSKHDRSPVAEYWTYLSPVPCNAHNDPLGDTFPWLKNAC